jgi:hypothetical protein
VRANGSSPPRDALSQHIDLPQVSLPLDLLHFSPNIRASSVSATQFQHLGRCNTSPCGTFGDKEFRRIVLILFLDITTGFFVLLQRKWDMRTLRMSGTNT